MSARRLRIGQLDWQSAPGSVHVYLWCADDASADAEADISFSIEEWPVIGPLVDRDIKPVLADVAGDGEDVEAWFEREKGSLAALYGERLQRVEARGGSGMSGANPNWEITEELWEPEKDVLYIVFEQETFWSARFLPGDGSELELNACSEDGEHIDWPSRGTAKEICQAHRRLVLAGHTPETAAHLLTELSLEYLREKQGLAALIERGVRGHATH